MRGIRWKPNIGKSGRMKPNVGRCQECYHILLPYGHRKGRYNQGYRIWSDSPCLGLVPADSIDRIRNVAANAVAFWLLESGIAASRPEQKSICDSFGCAGKLSQHKLA